MSTAARYCSLSSHEQQKQQDLARRIQELEAALANTHEEEEVRHEFGDRDKMRQTMFTGPEFEDDFEEFDQTSEADQQAKIARLEQLVQRHTVELEDAEKENLDNRLVLTAEYKEQLKMIDFFKELIGTQIGRGELEQLRLQSQWSDRDAEFKVPVFYAKNGRVAPLKLPKHEMMMKLAELHDSRSLRLKTEHTTQKLAMSLNLDDEDEPPRKEDVLARNQRIDASFYKSRSCMEDTPPAPAPARLPNPLLRPRPPRQPNSVKLPPLAGDN